ncbi:MAG: hypothetical protein J2P52_08330, partial [Blastocatellia bacterium]|nr:hypothetical protein [Blastocatellia bacterium]
MSDETVENSTIREYLLGNLPESEAERIERWYFAGGQAVDEVWAAFGEMAEGLLNGALPENEARRFEQRLQSSPALREMFENEKAIHNYAATIAAGASAQVKSQQIKSEDPVAGGRRMPVTFFKSPRLVAVGAAAVISIGAFGLWLILKAPESPKPENSRQAQARDQKDGVARSSIERQRPPGPGSATNDRPVEGKKSATAQPDRSKSAPGAGTETTATFLLLAGGTRGGESYTTLEIPGRTETVQLELELPTDDCADFSAVLQRESGGELQRWERLRARRAYSSLNVARLRVHASSLKNASYVMRVECVST